MRVTFPCDTVTISETVFGSCAGNESVGSPGPVCPRALSATSSGAAGARARNKRRENDMSHLRGGVCRTRTVAGKASIWRGECERRTPDRSASYRAGLGAGKLIRDGAGDGFRDFALRVEVNASQS